MFIDRRRGDVDLRQEVLAFIDRGLPINIALLTEGGRKLKTQLAITVAR